jgi:two-component system, NarL family, response regulator NreC
MALRILLADDHQVVRQGFRAVLETYGFEVVAEASDGREAIELADRHRPDLAILDLSMPVVNGLNAASEIMRRVPHVRIVLLTVHTEEHHVAAALRAGVRGYVLKSQAAGELIQAIQDVAHGGTYLSSKVSGLVVEAYLSGRTTPADLLAPRERQVLQLVAEGKTSKEIASLLGISAKSAESYRSRIMDKLDIHDTAGLVRYAIRHHLIQP